MFIFVSKINACVTHRYILYSDKTYSRVSTPDNKDIDDDGYCQCGWKIVSESPRTNFNHPHALLWPSFLMANGKCNA